MEVIDSLFSTVAKISSVADVYTFISLLDEIILQVFKGGVFTELVDIYCVKLGILDWVFDFWDS